MSGKGDKQRRGDSEKLISNWDRIFGGEKEEKADTEDVEPFHIKNARVLVTNQAEWEEEQARKKRKREADWEAEFEKDQKRKNRKQ